VILEYTRHQRYCDIGVSLISQHLSYRSSPAVISGYTDITALSCDIGVIRISGFQISYLISKFQNSDIGTYTDVTAPDIRVIQIQLIPAMLYGTRQPWFRRLETTSHARKQPEGAGQGVTLSLGPPPPLLLSSRHSSRPAIQKVSNNEAFIISITRIEMG